MKLLIFSLILLLLAVPVEAATTIGAWQEKGTTIGAWQYGLGNKLVMRTRVKFREGTSYVDYCADVNCMGCWRFDEDERTPLELDISGEDEHLSETGGTVVYISGREGNARHFELDDTASLTVADGGSTDISGANQDLSYCFWLNLESNGADQGIIDKYESDTSDRQYKIRYDTSSDTMIAFLSADGGGAGAESVTASSNDYDDGWHHTCFVYNDTDMRIYKDGDLDCTPVAYINGISDEPAPLYIGSSQYQGAANGHLDGTLDEVAIFDRALTAAEIKDIYENGLR